MINGVDIFPVRYIAGAIGEGIGIGPCSFASNGYRVIDGRGEYAREGIATLVDDNGRSARGSCGREAFNSGATIGGNYRSGLVFT